MIAGDGRRRAWSEPGAGARRRGVRARRDRRDRPAAGRQPRHPSRADDDPRRPAARVRRAAISRCSSGRPRRGTGSCSCSPRRSSCRTRPTRGRSSPLLPALLVVLCGALGADRDARREDADPARAAAARRRGARRAARHRHLARGGRVSGTLAWALVALGLAVVVVRRRSVAVGLVTAQALLLAGVAHGRARRAPTTSQRPRCARRPRRRARGAVPRRSSRAHASRGRSAPASRRSRAAGLAIAARARAHLARAADRARDRAAERAMLALVAFGTSIVATRRATLFQVLGIVIVENGLVARSARAPGRPSLAIELGVALDLRRSSRWSPSSSTSGSSPSSAPATPPRWGASVTSRETLALAAVGAPGARPALVAAVRRRARRQPSRSPAASSPARVAIALAVVALATPPSSSSRRLGRRRRRRRADRRRDRHSSGSQRTRVARAN